MTPRAIAPQRDTRTLSLAPAQLRLVQVDGKERLQGYAAVFNQLSEDLGGFRELIRPGAFTSALEGADVRLLINHDPSIMLGRTVSGTLRLVQDAHGLFFDADPLVSVITSHHLESIRRGDMSGCSFRFYMWDDPTLGQVWHSTADGVTREITEIGKVDDVSAVTYPAYTGTDVSLRALDHAKTLLRPPARPVDVRSMGMRLRLAERS